MNPAKSIRSRQKFTCQQEFQTFGFYPPPLFDYVDSWTVPKLLYKFTHDLKDGTTIGADNYFFCPKAMRAAKRKWAKKKRFIFTVPGTCFPEMQCIFF